MTTPAPNGENGKNSNGKVPLLPRWFAAKGPRPYWLAENWSLILAVMGSALVLLNMLTAQRIFSTEQGEWVNAAVAWLSAGALFLQSRQSKVMAVAKWRDKIRREEAGEPPEQEPKHAKDECSPGSGP
jgi:hypothetical protein